MVACVVKKSQIPSPIVPINITQQVFTDANIQVLLPVIPAGWFMVRRFYVENFTTIRIFQRILQCINDLIKDCTRNPFKGISKPEPLKGTMLVFGAAVLWTNIDRFVQ